MSTPGSFGPAPYFNKIVFWGLLGISPVLPVLLGTQFIGGLFFAGLLFAWVFGNPYGVRPAFFGALFFACSAFFLGCMEQWIANVAIGGLIGFLVSGILLLVLFLIASFFARGGHNGKLSARLLAVAFGSGGTPAVGASASAVKARTVDVNTALALLPLLGGLAFLFFPLGTCLGWGKAAVAGVLFVPDPGVGVAAAAWLAEDGGAHGWLSYVFADAVALKMGQLLWLLPWSFRSLRVRLQQPRDWREVLPAYWPCLLPVLFFFGAACGAMDVFPRGFPARLAFLFLAPALFLAGAGWNIAKLREVRRRTVLFGVILTALLGVSSLIVALYIE